ncbi:hypothetical protein TNCV_1314241, partial [Trichonephila clavipes]
MSAGSQMSFSQAPSYGSRSHMVKELPMPGYRPMKQLAVRLHFLRYDKA